jgi:hypothetical protein
MFCGMFCGVSTCVAAAEDDRYSAVVQPFFDAHCLGCHEGDGAEGEFRLDRLDTSFAATQTAAAWSEIVNVMNGHEMPPEDQPQPTPEDVAQVVDWITEQLISAESSKRESSIVLRRLNRNEYKNTIRDLIGVEVDVSGFPEDPPAGGFDNNGSGLSMSPLLMEIYFQSAVEVLDRALVDHPRPPTLRWRFQPETGDGDGNRVSYDGQRVIVNGGKNRVVDDYKVLHHDNWDRSISIRDFAVPHAGTYIVRIHAAGHVPSRSEVTASAEKFLAARRDRDTEKNPERKRYHDQAYERDLHHFRTDPMYRYGPPRLKLTQTLGGQPRVVDEFDVDAPLAAPHSYETKIEFTTERGGLGLEYAYSIPAELENFWFQSDDDFARPELWIDWVELEGPIHEDWPPESHRCLTDADRYDQDFGNAQARVTRAQKIVSETMRRAYRRPVTADEVAGRMALFDASNPDFVQAIKAPLTAILVSPNFLFLVEPAAAATAGEESLRRQLSSHEIATRLSYFLWSSMPDQRLFDLAESNRLLDPVCVCNEVDRMLADPRSDELVNNFAGQWLGLREVGANPPAKDLYRRYDRHLEESIVEESQAFFAEILHHDLSVMNFASSDFVVINERLARYYEIDGVRGDHFRRVMVPEGIHRGGVVTQASVLSITSNGTRTSPVKRGTWIMKNLLGIDPGLPVANVGDIAPKVPGIDKATVRQRLEIHRQLPQCARCHNKIDPLGFALENFDAAGRWREREGFGYKGRVGDNDPLIDASATMIDGTQFTGVDGLRSILVERDTLFLRCLTEKMLTYALGRELGIADRDSVTECVDHLRQGDQSLRQMIHWIVTSEVFTSR